MRKGFHVTYEIITKESSRHCEAAEAGFVLPGNWHNELESHVFGEAAGKVKDDSALTLREALDLFSGYACEDSGRWFTECDSRIDYRTGDNERRNLHPPKNITRASYARLRRLLRSH